MNGRLKNFIEQITKIKRKANLSSLVNHGLPDGAGEKGGKAKAKRRRSTVNDTVQNLPVVDRLKQRNLHIPCSTQSASTPVIAPVTTSSSVLLLPSSQPYFFKALTPQIKVCAGCRLSYSNRKMPYDVCVVHKETRSILNPQNNHPMLIPVNAHYHATKSCLMKSNPNFTINQLAVPDDLKGKLSGSLYQTLLDQEFGTGFLH